MDKELFIETLGKGTNKLELRTLLINSCLKNPSYITILLENTQQVDDKNSSFSIRILELVCKEKLTLILPHLDIFTNLLSKLKQEASIRACAKICELLMAEYFVTKNSIFLSKITEKYLESITESGFDWLIDNQSTAIQAYMMYSLYLLGSKNEWIHPELVLILEKNIPTGSVGLVNRARKIIKAIETKKRFKL